MEVFCVFLLISQSWGGFCSVLSKIKVVFVLALVVGWLHQTKVNADTCTTKDISQTLQFMIVLVLYTVIILTKNVTLTLVSMISQSRFYHRTYKSQPESTFGDQE